MVNHLKEVFPQPARTSARLAGTGSPGHQLLYAGFGIDLPKPNGVDTFELPVPGTFVLDRRAVVRGAFVDPYYKKRMEPDTISAVLQAMSVEA